jgi:hypothetical protein
MGDYDRFKEPKYITKGWDYICYTNNKKLKSNVVDIRYTDGEGLTNARFCRKVWCFHNAYADGYDLSISTGAQQSINGNLDKFVKEVWPNDKSIDMVITSHPNRNCVYEEAKRCIKRDEPQKVRSQMEFYKKEGYPKNNGLIAGGIIIRQHDRKNVIEHCEKWWEQIQRFSLRNQLSFNYVLWKYNLIKIKYISYDYFRGKNGYFKKEKHKKHI